jgi:hypothetical protein
MEKNTKYLVANEPPYSAKMVVVMAASDMKEIHQHSYDQ